MVLTDELLLISAEYSVKNGLLALYIVLAFLFWWFVYSKSPKLELNKDNIVLSLTSLVLNFVCWVWFIFLFWLLRTVLFVSRSSTFLEDKLSLINTLSNISIFLISIIFLLNVLKYLYKVSSFNELLKELVFEIRGKGRK